MKELSCTRTVALRDTIGMEIDRLSTRTVYENRWMRVREDEIQRKDGSRGIYGVVEKPDYALVIPRDDSGFFLVEQFRYPVQERCWEFPQGSWDEPTDATSEALARSELLQETGLRAAEIRHLGRLYEAYGFCSQAFDVYLATELRPGSSRLRRRRSRACWSRTSRPLGSSR